MEISEINRMVQRLRNEIESVKKQVGGNAPGFGQGWKPMSCIGGHDRLCSLLEKVP